VFIFSELLNLQDSVDCEPIAKMYYFTIIYMPFILVERDGKWDEKLGKLAVYVHINLEDAKHLVPFVIVYHQLHPVSSSS
jgi:hypothetical protein